MSLSMKIVIHYTFDDESTRVDRILFRYLLYICFLLIFRTRALRVRSLALHWVVAGPTAATLLWLLLSSAALSFLFRILWHLSFVLVFISNNNALRALI